MNAFEEIKRIIKLSEYARKFLNLKLRSGRFLGLCPFHKEKTPSFNIDPAKELYHCFGCGSSGDLFDFQMQFQGMNKQEALQFLANHAGVTLKEKKDFQKNALEFLRDFCIQNSSYEDFLSQKGINKEIAKKFEIGWMPPKNEIIEFIKDQKIEQDLKEYGFSEGILKLFERRIIFPIYNKNGILCSFGGRALDSRAKYINGPASKFFDKSSILYGANFAYSGRKLYLVEGYTDVMMMYQSGFQAVAALGTSFGDRHLQQSWDISDNLVVAMDADLAGEKSAYRIAKTSLSKIKVGKTIAFLALPNGEDPASCAQKNMDFSNFKEKSLHEYIFQERYYINSPDQAAEFLEKLLQFADEMKDPILKSQYKKTWKNMWWDYGKNKKNIKVNIPTFELDKLLLLLFKYVTMDRAILGEVAEQFLNIKIPNEPYKAWLISILEKEIVPVDLQARIEDLMVFEPLDTREQILESWYKTARHIEKLLSNEKEKMVNSLSENFSQDEWERFKKWNFMKEEEEEDV